MVFSERGLPLLWSSVQSTRDLTIPQMKARKLYLLLAAAALLAIALYAARLISRGFSTADEPSYLERTVARAARNLAIPRHARLEVNPFNATPEIPKESPETLLDRCA